jgi:hypothetical protein
MAHLWLWAGLFVLVGGAVALDLASIVTSTSR